MRLEVVHDLDKSINTMQTKNYFSLTLLNNKFPGLHGLRAIGILLVVQLHSMIQLLTSKTGVNYDSSFVTISLNAWFGMDLFFIMSGLLIGIILFEARKSNEHNKFMFRFYLRRSLRILPLYYAFYFIYYFLRPSKDITVDFHELFYLTNYPFIPEKNLIPWAWSLCVEEHFYLLSPLLVNFLYCMRSHRHRIYTLIAFWFGGILVRYFIYLIHREDAVFNVLRYMYTPTHARFDIFIAGILLAYLIVHFHEKVASFYQKKIVRIMSFLIPVCIFGALLLPQLNPTPLALNFESGAGSFWTAWTGILYYGTFTSLGYAPLILAVIYMKNPFIEFLRSRFFLKVGTLGYGVYLVRYPINSLVQNKIFHGLNQSGGHFVLIWFFNTVMTLLISLVVAYVLHLIIEKPALWIRDRYIP